MKSYFVFLLAGLMLATSLSARETAKLTGSVIDYQTGEGVIGANVYLEGTSLGAATDMDGGYAILNIAPGNYTLVVMMIGYAELRVGNVEIKSGEIVKLNLTLRPEVLQTEVVTVEARAINNTSAAMLKKRQKAAAVSDAVSAEAMSRAGSGSAAEAMKQVTGASVVDGKYVYIRGLGDRYTSTRLNGAELPGTNPYKRAAAIDLIPGSLVDNIVTLKSFLPDKPGNFSGGAVDINTRDFPDKLEINVSTSTSFNPEINLKSDGFLSSSGSRTDWLGYDDGRRALPGILNDPSVVTPDQGEARNDYAKAELLDKITRGFSPEMTPVRSTAPLNQSYSISMGNQILLFNRPLGMIGSFSYGHKFSGYGGGVRGKWFLTGDPLSMDSTQYLRDNRSTTETLWGGLFKASYKVTPNNMVSFNVMINQNGEDVSQSLSGYFEAYEPDIFKTTLLAYKQRSLQSYQFKGEHFLPALLKSKLMWSASFMSSVQDEPDYRNMAYGIGSKNGNKTYTIKVNTPPARYFKNLDEKRNTLTLDWSLPFKQWNGLRGKIKVGAYGSRRGRGYRERLFKYATPSSFNQGGFNQNGNPDSLFAGSEVGLIDTASVTIGGKTYKYNEIGLSIFEVKKPLNSYRGREDIAAGYMMMELPLTSSLKFIGGARFEQTETVVLTGDSTIQKGFVPLESRIRENDWLPSINLVYNVMTDMNLRAAYTKTLARPSMREMAPYASEDYIGSYVYIGNDSLRRTMITNYDLRWEWFSRAGELYAVSAFYKDFQNPIEPVIFGNNRERTWETVKQARVMGLEFEARTRLDIIHPGLSGFSVGANLSLINSRVDISKTQQLQKSDTTNTSRPLQGQSPYVVNMTLNYDNMEHGLHATLYYNVFGERLSDVGQRFTPDVYEQPFDLLNVTFNWDITDQFAFKATATNLLDSEVKKVHKFMGREYIESSYKPGRLFSFGLDYKL